MGKLPVKILWKASDGREFTINTTELGLKSMDDVHKHISELRKKYGYEEPTFMHVEAKPGYDVGPTVDASELPDHLRKEVERVIKEGKERPDPKKQN